MDNLNCSNPLESYSTFFPQANFDLFGEYDFESHLPDFAFPGFELGQLGVLDSEAQNSLSSQNTSLEHSASDFDSSLVNKLSDAEYPCQANNALLTPASLDLSNPTSQETTTASASTRHRLRSPVPSLDEYQNNETAKRRKWEESVVVFSANENRQVVPTRRKRFALTRRKDVALNRLIGACVRCKLRKAACDFGMPCQQCLKRVSKTSLGHQICTRQSLMSVRFNDLDLYTKGNEEGWELEARTFIPNPERTVWVSYPSCCGGSKKFYPAKIQDYHPVLEVPDRLLVSWGYRDCETTLAPDRRTAFLCDFMPSLEDLLYCRETRHHFCDSGPFQGLHKAFSQFAEEYCMSSSALPQKTLLGKVLRMRLLLGLYRMWPIMKYAEDSPQAEIASWAMERQLRDCVREEAVKLEAEVLHELEKLLYGVDSIGRQNPLVIWVCLWLLILYYKSHLSFTWFNFGGRSSVIRLVYGLARHLYNAVTSIYSALYKTTTPLTFDWRKDEISEMLGRDPQLIRSFCNIKTEMFWLHAERHDLLDEDNLFEALVVENDSKLLESHKKAARKQGIL